MLFDTLPRQVLSVGTLMTVTDGVGLLVYASHVVRRAGPPGLSPPMMVTLHHRLQQNVYRYSTRAAP